jgi:hypothetical protein
MSRRDIRATAPLTTTANSRNRATAIVSTLYLANIDVDGKPAINLRHHSHADRFIPPADRFAPAIHDGTTSGGFALDAPGDAYWPCRDAVPVNSVE